MQTEVALILFTHYLTKPLHYPQIAIYRFLIRARLCLKTRLRNSMLSPSPTGCRSAIQKANEHQAEHAKQGEVNHEYAAYEH